MSIFPQRTIISGTGSPRFIKELSLDDSEYYETSGSPVYTETSVIDTEAIPASVQPGMRVRALNTGAALAGKAMYAKILSVDSETNTMTIDAWVGANATYAKPTNAQAFIIDGWIADLPRCEKLTEIFEPDLLIHSMFRSRVLSKQFGWKYSATLDYASFFSPDAAFEIRRILAFSGDGDGSPVVFLPRSDKPGFQIPVLFDAPFEITMHPSKAGFKSLNIAVRGKHSIAIPPMFQFGGYGVGYGENFGEQL